MRYLHIFVFWILWAILLGLVCIYFVNYYLPDKYCWLLPEEIKTLRYVLAGVLAGMFFIKLEKELLAAINK